MDKRTLAVVCWLWKGWRPVYTHEHVHILQEKCAEFFPEHSFYCVTDQVVPGIDCIPLPDIGWMRHDQGVPSSYYKLWAFSEAARALGDYIVSIDLDSLILGDMGPLIGSDDSKVLRGYCCPYNTSIFQVKTGEFPYIWNDLHKIHGKTGYGSDQAYLAHKLPNMPTWSHHDGIHQYATLSGDVPKDSRIIFFAGDVKPWNSRYKTLYFS